jgi:ketosteroid isomerase-like protein
MLTDDAVYLPPNEPAIVGKEALRPWIEGYFQAYRTHWEKETLEVIATGDWAIEYAAERSKDIPVGDGDALEDVGKGIVIYRRQADGSWKVARDIWNSDGSATA